MTRVIFCVKLFYLSQNIDANRRRQNLKSVALMCPAASIRHEFEMPDIQCTRRKRVNKQTQDLEKLRTQVDGGGKMLNSLTLIVFTLLAIQIFMKLFDLSIAYSLARSFLFYLTLSQPNSLLFLLPHSISLCLKPHDQP